MGLEWVNIAILSAILFGVSAVFMMFGQGGGSIYVPLLLAFGIPIYRAAATSQLLIMSATLSALLIYHRARLVDWWLALIIEPPTNLGAFFGGYLSPHFPERISKLIFSGILLLGAYFMIKPISNNSAIIQIPQKRWFQVRRKVGENTYSLNLLIVIPIMVLAGFVAGMLGVGGGIFKVPALVLLGGVPMKVAVGTSSLMVGFTALTGLIGHTMVGHFNLKLALFLAMAVFLGSQIGARLGVKVEKGKQKVYFGYLLIFIAFWMVYMAFK